MTQADSVYSTPPTNTSLTRRNMIGAMATVGAIATAAPATAGLAEPDPIFAAIDAFRRADAEFMAPRVGDIPDEVGDRQSDAYYAVLRTRPTTMAGLVALTALVRERADWLCPHSLMSGEELCALTAAINDAARSMSGLEPWSPPLPATVEGGAA
jgi:hypothetical protein